MALMVASELWRTLIDIENQLGWSPADEPSDIPKARAMAHHILTRAMTKRNVAVADLRLAIAYAKTKQLMIESPLQLLSFIDKARQMATTEATTTSLEQRVRDAITWELDHAEEDSNDNNGNADQWYMRLVRAGGPARAGLLQEWRDAGRGDPTD
jgi:hypothetical protein